MAEGTCDKVKSIFGTVYKALKSLTSLTIILVLYNIIGALLFVYIEAPFENEEIAAMKSDHEHWIRVLSNITSALKGPEYDILRNETESFLARYEMESRKLDQRKSWDFWKALFFCGTIYTTIGYGNIYPKTDMGKVAAMFYAALGIPLAMRVLAEIGKKLSVVLKLAYLRIKRCCNIKKHTKNSHDVELNDTETDVANSLMKEEPEKHDAGDNQVPVAIPIFILILYIILGGVMYTWWEKWGYLDSFYFVVISLCTIGFGDITPAHTKYFIVTSIYLFIGLALVSMCINVLIEIYVMSMKAAVHQMDKVRGKVASKVKKVKKRCHCGSSRESISSDTN